MIMTYSLWAFQIREAHHNTVWSAVSIVLYTVAVQRFVEDCASSNGFQREEMMVGSEDLAAKWLSDLAKDTGLPPRLLPVVAVGSLLVNPLLLSAVGLEPYLTAALFTGLLRYGVARRGAAFGVVAGLCVLARPDTAVVVIVVALVLRPGWARAISAVLAVTLPWYVFSWVVLGSALPDTLVIKVGGSWAEYEFWNGPLLYLIA